VKEPRARNSFWWVVKDRETRVMRLAIDIHPGLEEADTESGGTKSLSI
jgi:hypothetical protein